ncbi:MAG: hypothetical protein ACM3TR_04400 [Caulobacteraceae bacterium]
MKIESSSIGLQSNYSYVGQNEKTERAKLWVGNPPEEDPDKPPGILVDISDIGKELLKTLSSTEVIDSEEEYTDLLDEKDKQKIKLLEKLFEVFWGKKFKFTIPDKILIKNGTVNRPVRAGWGLEYDYHSMHYEREKVSFAADGIIKTSDGKEIAIDLQLYMSREFYTREDISIRAGGAVKMDPLVINFDAPAAKLTGTKFSFDIDCDGSSEQISSLAAGSGFLSFDANNDGRINDGSELFGPQSGNGFSDLANYDDDKNGWIDENDRIFDKLRIWSKDEYGNDYLFALGQKGIGAIYLGNVSTPFSMRGAGNIENGQVQKTGIFVKEDGIPGTVQHVDLAV